MAAFHGDTVELDLTGRVSELMHGLLVHSTPAIARSSSQGRVEAVARSGHYIQFGRPDVVIHAVQAMLEAGG